MECGIRHRVLIVDDSKTTRDGVAEMVADAGLIPVVAADAREGLEHVRDGIDLVISEIRLPDVDGIDFLQAIRVIDRTLPLLLIARNAGPANLAEAETLEVAGLLTKPFTHFEFREALDAALYGGRRTLSHL